jgi:hypothetical protein
MADTNLLILAREFKKLRTHVQEVLKMPVGPQGLQGETGEQGVKGDTGAPGKDGKDGKDGVNGLNGQDGRNGVDGNDGKDGLDGVGVQNAYIDFDNSLVIVLTSGQEINAGFLSQETKDAVVATFKQGAQTINELLPNQTGNAGKYLTTDGTNISWASIAGGLSYQGTWNASTNTPTLASGVGTNGYYYITATAGSTNLDGITDWQIGDWLMFNGTVWQKIDQSNLVTSVNGQTGAVSLDAADVGAEPADATILKDVDIGVTVQGYNANTVIDASYVHTDNNYTTTEKSKLAGIAAGAEVNVNADWNAVSGDAQILNKPTLYSDASVDTHLNTSTATSAQVLSWTGTDYDWVTPSSGSVTSVTGTSPVVSSGGTTPAISLASGYGDTQNPYASKTANNFLAAPNGSAGVPTFRAIAAADIPTLNQNTTGTANNVTGIVAVANGGTGTATPSLVAGTNITISGSFPNQTINASGGGSALTVQDEGSTLTSAATSLNFTGAGVTATNTGGAVTVNIAGGGGGTSSPIPKLQSWSIGAM